MENLQRQLNLPPDSALAKLLLGVGLLTSLHLVFQVSSFVLLYIRPSKLHRYLHTTDGRPAWALVTGASDGIGKHLARLLAAKGFNVVLHGRNPTKLAGVETELVRDFPERTFRTLIADASAVPCVNCRGPSQASPPARSTRSHAPRTAQAGADVLDFDAIAESLGDVNLTVLINNAGGGPVNPLYAPLQDIPESTIAGNVNLNAVFPLILQSKLLPQLIRSGPSLIMGIGSLSDNDMPLLSSYAPSKVFVRALAGVLSRELAMEGRGADVEVVFVRVGETCGTVYNKHEPSLFEPDARTMAEAALARVGCGRIVVTGYWPHALQQVFMDYLPASLKDWMVIDAIRKRRVEDQKLMKSS